MVSYTANVQGFINLTILSGQPHTPPALAEQKPTSLDKPVSGVLSLPAELIQQVLDKLSPVSLALLSQTCRTFQRHAYDERLWRRIVQDQTPSVVLRSPFPCNTFRELYISFRPYWFLPKNKIWFSDEPNVGKLVFARFDPERGVIEGYRLIASPGHRAFSRWEWDPDVGIHSFNPKVVLWLDQPVLKLSGGARKGSFSRDVRMDLGMEDNGIFSELFLARAISPERLDPSMELWPPQNIPAKHHVRSTSHDSFSGKWHRPQHFHEICEGAFRIKKWMEFRANMGLPFGIRMGEEVSTYSTLPEDAYTPTSEKPWNGIWVGDYSGHGCEFLLVQHSDDVSPRRRVRFELEDVEVADVQDREEGDIRLKSQAEPLRAGDRSLRNRPEYVPKGGLEAIKLTGDPNVPRGECSFVADNIGEGGFIRVAQEEIFRGARIVKCRGHIAGHNFRNDKFIPSQLIMISPDRLAQYWEDFGHISYYERVNIDDLAKSQ
ncbi:MAG: hypothetical protein M1836_003509 [Candelina mexicana]|nr:MAG: hypothetical protein M1836_003509 [Candelina mexicana]